MMMITMVMWMVMVLLLIIAVFKVTAGGWEVWKKLASIDIELTAMEREREIAIDLSINTGCDGTPTSEESQLFLKTKQSKQ